ncbi:TonB-dependent receptor [Aureibaculum sp. A20]|uniref:TonB-dependent receptor n=2 Tax=Aureibaculum flavum TaxID=2795986 RepID=A0ABS0WS29_9FLAO|nr:TonB-dependent receptor [Aureibaculum flavum]
MGFRLTSKIPLLLLFFIFTLTANAQEITVSGMVTSADDNLPLPGVNVIIKGTTNGTSTDFDGNYSISVNKGEVLDFSFIGFTNQSITVGDQTEINVVMQVDAQALDEVVVVGYGELKVKDLTSAITTIKAEEIGKTPTGQAMQALQGKVAGLQVVSSGAPGASPTIRVRGIGSYPGVGDESPLYVVDGMFYDNIDFLNPSDIASISVLKDASASAIYGVKAANGVILIETNSGKFNQKGKITYDGYYGTQIAQNVLKMANSEQFVNMAMESGSPADIGYVQNAMQRYGRSRTNPNVPDVNTDWYDEILRPAAIMNHSLNFTGGSENASYAVGTNYFAQEGVLDMKNEYERFNVRAKLDFKVNNWLTVGGNTIFSNGTTYAQEESAWFTAYYAVPIMPVLDPSNTEAWPTPYASAEDLGYRGAKNPRPVMDNNRERLKIRKILANFYVDMEIVPEKLSFKTSYNHSYETLNKREAGFPYFVSNGSQRQRESAFVTKRSEVYSKQIWDNVLTFTNTFDDHDVTIMAGTSFRDDSFDFVTGTGTNYPYDLSDDNEELWYLSQSEAETRTADDGGSRQYGMSYFGRVSYNFKDKYLVYGTFRADGSSKFQEKWGYFPTIGAGWVLSSESFMEDNNVIDYLKVRASWGQLGNDKVPASDGANSLSTEEVAIGDQLETGTVGSNTFDYLKWERTEEYNIGLTSRILDNKLSIEADYYIRNTKNAIIPINVPATGQSIRRNSGEIRNSGFELSLDWKNSISDKLSYNVGVNLSTLKNEVIDIFGQDYIDGGSAEFRQRTLVGEPLLAFFGYEVAGVYQNDAEIAADPTAQNEINNNNNILVPGDFKYQDMNNDGKIDGDDRVVLGSYLPSFNYGLNLGVDYKNFSFSANMLGQTGNKILNRKRGEVIFTPDGNMDADLAINRWHGEGTSNTYPSSSGLRRGWNQKMSDYLVEDGSFFRLQNVRMAYKFNGEELFGTPMPNATISLTAERPLTVFGYNGFNPEVQDGIDRQVYPIPAVYTVGLNIIF